MKTCTRVMGVIFTRTKNGIRFLILHRVLNWHGWEFFKGHLDEGETPEQAVKREMIEETGIPEDQIISLSQMKVKNEWKTEGELCTCDTFLIEVPPQSGVSLATDIVEHDAYKWSTKEEAEQLLTHENSKAVLNAAVKKIS